VTRLVDWDARLAEWANALMGRPFCWGGMDCAQICLEAWSVITGNRNPHAGAYSDMHGALRYQRDVCSIQAALLELGCVAVQPGFQQRGDFILVRDDPWRVGNVCMGEASLSAHPERGVVSIDTAWLLEQPEALVLRAA
jgi:hypothetical protein